MQYLGLQNDPRLYIRIGDATELLETAETADLIFVDLYNDSGPDAAHLAWSFLKRCQESSTRAGGSSSTNGAPTTTGRWELPCCVACITGTTGNAR